MTVCSVCFRVCSFNRPDTTISRFVKWLIHNVPELNRLFVWLDEITGYDKMPNPNEYWKT